MHARHRNLDEGRVHAERARWFVAFGGVQFTVSVSTDREARDDEGESTLWVSACDAAGVPAAVDEAVRAKKRSLGRL